MRLNIGYSFLDCGIVGTSAVLINAILWYSRLRFSSQQEEHSLLFNVTEAYHFRKGFRQIGVVIFGIWRASLFSFGGRRGGRRKSTTSTRNSRKYVSKCDVSQQITVVDGRYMLDIVVGERVEFIILSNERIVRTITCMIHTVTLDLAYVDLRLFIRPTVSTV